MDRIRFQPFIALHGKLVLWELIGTDLWSNPCQSVVVAPFRFNGLLHLLDKSRTAFRFHLGFEYHTNE